MARQIAYTVRRFVVDSSGEVTVQVVSVEVSLGR